MAYRLDFIASVVASVANDRLDVAGDGWAPTQSDSVPPELATLRADLQPPRRDFELPRAVAVAASVLRR